MHNSKLIQILRQLSTKELTWFGEFIRSPFFNKNQDLVQFYQYIKQYAPRFKSADLQKEKVYTGAFPDREHDDKRLGYIMSDLVKLAEQFIDYQRYQQEPVLSKYHLMLTFNEWNLEKHYRSAYRKARKEQKNNPYRDTNYYLNEYFLATVSNEYFYKQRKHKYDETLQETVDNLDTFYLARKLKYLCEMINRKNLLSADYDLRLLDELVTYLQQEELFTDVPAIGIYFRILMTLLEEDNPTHFDRLKALLDQYSDQFPKKEARDMYVSAQNFCVRKVNAGDTEYLEELFELYRTVLEKEIIFEDGRLSPWTYKNIVGVALRLDEFEWVEEFIEDYKPYLAPEFRDNAYNFNKANLFYYQEKYKEALQLLQMVDISDVSYYLNVKMLMLKIYYETDDIEPLLSLIDAFKVFLRRNKFVSSPKRKTHHNFLKYTQRLLNIADGEKEKLREFREELKQSGDIVNIQWLQEKVDEKIKQ